MAADHKMLGTEGNGQLRQPSVKALLSGDPETFEARALADRAASVVAQRRVRAAATDGDGGLPPEPMHLE